LINTHTHGDHVSGNVEWKPPPQFEGYSGEVGTVFGGLTGVRRD
jgi:hypothetical protein